jgi:hypothetical protein
MNKTMIQAGRDHMLIFLILVFLLPTGCVTTPRKVISEAWVEQSILSLREGCKLSLKSGFTADLLVSNQGGARIDAAWDASGLLNGQVVNAIGEDVLNFKIDSSGFLQTDNSFLESESLVQALEFLAQLGSQKTRSLLCSGLFVQPLKLSQSSDRAIASEVETVVENSGSQWRIGSRVLPDSQDDSTVVVETTIFSDSFFFRKSLAKISWRGKRLKKTIQPNSLLIITSQSEIKLSFLDFE